MPTQHARTHCPGLVPVLLGALLMLSACQKPVVSDASSPILVGGVELKVGRYEVRYIELNDGDKVIQYPDPVLVIPVTVTNKGKNEQSYNPSHALTQVSEASAPLLYKDPGAEAELPPENKVLISSIKLKTGTFPGQVKATQSVKPGASINDVLLFQVPPKDATNLVLSLPPTMHRDKVPALFRLKYTPQPPKGRKIHQVGGDVAFGDVSFKVTSHRTEYVRTKTSGKDGFSRNPLFKIAYTITNNGKTPITYDANHKATGDVAAPRLASKSESFKRIRFDNATTPNGQQEGKKVVESGKSISDYVLFEMPGPNAQEIVLEFPAVLFKGKGIARVAIPYAYKKPAKPKELEKKAP